MSYRAEAEQLVDQYTMKDDHTQSDYFTLIQEMVRRREESPENRWQQEIDKVYSLVRDEICTNANSPTESIKFGTSGWRGILGKDVNVRTVACVTAAIVEMYNKASSDTKLLGLLGVLSLEEAQKRGCVVGYDNRFSGELFASVVSKVLIDDGFTVHYAGESTTGVLSAAVLELQAAFSINLTPSHNPLQYGGYKFNAADAGPAAAEVTERITRLACDLERTGYSYSFASLKDFDITQYTGAHVFDSLACWKNLVRKNSSVHGLDFEQIIERFISSKDMVVAVDSVHGASRIHLPQIFPKEAGDRLINLRDNGDVTFGGIAPEPSSVNMQAVTETLFKCKEKLKLGAIIDPDGDRIRFTDGITEISMNQFGAMAYHFLVKYRGKKGMVAKTVATSNMANALAKAFGEELFEPRVGFKEFKPVMGKAVVFFEESDGISIIGHTPEKDAYIGLLLALDMVLTTGINLGQYKDEIEKEYGAYFPDRDGVVVSQKGAELTRTLSKLEKYGVGVSVVVGGKENSIVEVITLDGRKMIFEDGSWLMIRPSGTEPKVRFYVESRTESGTADLVAAARNLLQEIGLLC